jgi:hypothetical protein
MNGTRRIPRIADGWRRRTAGPSAGAAGDAYDVSGPGSTAAGQFDAAANLARELAERDGDPISVVVLEVDAVTGVRRWDGGSAAVRLLASLSTAWRRLLRPADLVRPHGEAGFLIVLPGLDGVEAHGVVSRLRDAQPLDLTAVTTPWLPGETLETCLHRAGIELTGARAARYAGRVAPDLELTHSAA